MFVDCPLDSVYIGGNISYSTADTCGYSPFYRNTSLRAVSITDKETEISDNEFYGCTNLKYVSIGDGVESIGNWAFSGCSNLDYFAFGSGMKTIGEEAFSDCTAVTKIYSRATTPPVCGTQALDDINKWTCELYVPGENISDYQAADQWKEFFFMYDGVEGIKVDNNAIEVVRYDIHGRLLNEPTRGINIIKMSDGSTRKEIVK
ncbi:MAG: leucine-rich repeat protein [Muribaculaceae bacterium]|nr:leucine-rich repeat protein [Muribaculaceae bacterium]